MSRELRLTVPDEVSQRMARMEMATGASSPAQLIQRALSVYEFIFVHETKGHPAFVRDGEKEIPIPLKE